jgi:hypothetical protein
VIIPPTHTLVKTIHRIRNGYGSVGKNKQPFPDLYKDRPCDRKGRRRRRQRNGEMERGKGAGQLGGLPLGLSVYPPYLSPLEDH